MKKQTRIIHGRKVVRVARGVWNVLKSNTPGIVFTGTLAEIRKGMKA